jgi:hypothetical protein
MADGIEFGVLRVNEPGRLWKRVTVTKYEAHTLQSGVCIEAL